MQVHLPHLPFTLTTFLALWGAILSSITFGWNLLRDLRDRAKVSISADVKKIVTGPGGAPIAVRPDLFDDEPAKLFVVVSVVNVGRRPLRWKGLGGLYKRPVNGKRGFIVNTGSCRKR